MSLLWKHADVYASQDGLRAEFRLFSAIDSDVKKNIQKAIIHLEKLDAPLEVVEGSSKGYYFKSYSCNLSGTQYVNCSASFENFSLGR